VAIRSSRHKGLEGFFATGTSISKTLTEVGPLSLAFGTTAESWMNQQVQYDLWHAERNRKKLRVAKLSAA
jgi:plasmid maintenance system antidote protein VapI